MEGLKQELAFENLAQLNAYIDENGNPDGTIYWQCMDCQRIYAGIQPQHCECGNDSVNGFAKVIQSKKGKQQADKLAGESNDGWNVYKKQDVPHFKTVAEWLEAVKTIGNENRNQFNFCEGCEGIFVNHAPMTCECGNNLEEAFKEIDGQMRKQLIEGRTLKELNKYSYVK